MYKVVIIDDESIIRKGLIEKVDWAGANCIVCGEAADGTVGKALIQKEKPDIIFTDICMSEMDGLEMIRSVKEQIPDSKIIIISGYRNFAYAQQALELGAFCFICKPTKINEINAAVKRAAEQLCRERATADGTEKIKAAFIESIPTLRHQILLDALYGLPAEQKALLSKMEMVGLRIAQFRLFLVESDNNMPFRQGNGRGAQFVINEIVEKSFEQEFSAIMILINGSRAAFIVQTKDENIKEAAITQSTVLEKCESIRAEIATRCGFTVSIGISSSGCGIGELAVKFKECLRALEHKFYTGDNSIIPIWDISHIFSSGLLPALSPYKDVLLEEISTGNKEAAMQTLSNIVERISADRNGELDQIKSFYRNIFTDLRSIRNCVIAADKSKQQQSADMATLHRLLDQCDDIDQLNQLLQQAVIGVAEKCNAYNNRSISLKIQKAMEYVREHYGEQITLNEVAESLSVSGHYLSRIFKKESGLNFVDYLTEYRIEKAKELLQQVEYKTYEVANMVGFNDPFYFSKLFKKHTGMTPTEFRMG